MTAATNRRNRRANTRSRRRARVGWSARADRLTTMQVGGTTGTMSWFSRGAMRNQYETGAIKATYSYTDINNNLRVAQDAAGLTTSTYDGDNLRRKIVSGSVTTTFVWDGADYLQIKPSTGDATLLIALEGQVVGHVKGSEKRDYIVDPLGSIVAYLNSSQTMTDQFEYWPYGELVADIEVDTEPFLWVGSLGYFRDSDLRTYIRAREYRQDLGNWMQLDPLWPNQEGFAYGASNPVSLSDPFGLAPNIWFDVCLGAACAVANAESVPGVPKKLVDILKELLKEALKEFVIPCTPDCIADARRKHPGTAVGRIIRATCERFFPPSPAPSDCTKLRNIKECHVCCDQFPGKIGSKCRERCDLRDWEVVND